MESPEAAQLFREKVKRQVLPSIGYQKAPSGSIESDHPICEMFLHAKVVRVSGVKMAGGSKLESY